MFATIARELRAWTEAPFSRTGREEVRLTPSGLSTFSKLEALAQAPDAPWTRTSDVTPLEHALLVGVAIKVRFELNVEGKLYTVGMETPQSYLSDQRYPYFFLEVGTPEQPGSEFQSRGTSRAEQLYRVLCGRPEFGGKALQESVPE